MRVGGFLVSSWVRGVMAAAPGSNSGAFGREGSTPSGPTKLKAGAIA